MGNLKEIIQIEAMRAACISEPQIEKLRELREARDLGNRSELTIEHKRLVFARYLYKAKRIQ